MTRKLLIPLLAATMLVATSATPVASAQPPQQSGLINVNLEDITVQVPVSVAANICGLNVAAIAVNTAQGNIVQCTADSMAGADATASRDAGPGTTQEGLVNVNVEDVTVQIPVALAANVCGANVAILAVGVLPGNDVECDARARGIANNR
jgi:hypothetical protein